MNPVRQRPLAVGHLRSFESVARRLSFRAAAEELHLSQPAVSRQISALEQEVGCSLFQRGTRHVELTPDGAALLQTVGGVLDRLDATVRQIRQSKGRKVVNVTTFASFASLWLIPRLQAFQEEFPDIDIRVSAFENMVDLADGEFDLALRYMAPSRMPADAQRLFGETLTPVISAWAASQAESGLAPPLRKASDLAQYTLAEEDDQRPSGLYLSWRRWLTEQGVGDLQPRRWMYLNFTYQQVQAALAGQALALGRIALVTESLQRGELVEPFGLKGRLNSPSAYWLLLSEHSRQRPEVMQFVQWIQVQASLTREVLGEN